MNRHVVVFTVADETLLESRASIRRLETAGIAVIPISVMALEELAPIVAELELRNPMIIEAGGAIARWEGDRWIEEACAPPAEAILTAIQEIEDRSGARLLVVSAIDGSDAIAPRHFSEPFLIDSGDLRSIQRAAAEIGFAVRRGPRYYHLVRKRDEGKAFARIREELHCDMTVAVGRTQAELDLLTRADVAILASGEWAIAVEKAMREFRRPRRGRATSLQLRSA